MFRATSPGEALRFYTAMVPHRTFALNPFLVPLHTQVKFALIVGLASVLLPRNFVFGRILEGDWSGWGLLARAGDRDAALHRCADRRGIVQPLPVLPLLIVCRLSPSRDPRRRTRLAPTIAGWPLPGPNSVHGPFRSPLVLAWRRSRLPSLPAWRCCTSPASRDSIVRRADGEGSKPVAGMGILR